MSARDRILFVIAMMVALMAAAGYVRADEAPEKMNSETHTLVIEKLEQSLQRAKEDETVSLRPIRARLADLYAERARLRAMEEAEKNCGDCKGALADRKRALSLYETVVKEAPQETRGALLMQMAHLYDMNGQREKSGAIYERVVSEGSRKHGKAILAEAHVGRAERRFAKGDFVKSQKDFETALKMSAPGLRGPILHRIAWCHLNKGEQKQAVSALVNILKTPSLLTRESTDGPIFDESFQEDVARDLATFMAHASLSERDVRTVEALAPDRAKKETLKHLANECERLGQKKTAIFAWAAYSKYEPNKAERLEVMVRIAQVRFDMGDKAAALVGLKDAVAVWKQGGCEKDCENLQARLRRLVLDWNRLEKNEPSAQLFLAYNVYLEGFANDTEMTLWAGDVARAQKRYQEAAALYHKSSILAAGEKGKKGAKQILEASLVGEVEMAELSKSVALRQAAYDHYLTLNPQGAISSKVRYQRAYIAYERGEQVEASNRFHEFAVSADCRRANKEVSELCVQAADLDLDTLVDLGVHNAVESRANEYSRLYPKRRAEYGTMARTAAMKQAETQQAQAPDKALAKLALTDLSGASTDEKLRIYKMRLSLAERSRDLDETRAAARGLLGVKGLSEKDREFALGRLAWAAEMGLDFREAYSISLKMKMPSLRADERALRLALLAELSGNDARRHENEYLKLARNSEQKAMVRAKIVRSSRQPVRELAKHEAELKRYPSVFAPLVLEIFLRTNDLRFAERALNNRGVARSEAGRVMARQLFLRDFAQVERELARHRLNSSNDLMTKKTIAQRLKLLTATEKQANRAIATRDWTSQLVALSVLSRENGRLYADIMGLPVPKKLSAQMKLKYARLVEAKARVYLTKQQAIDKKIDTLWGDAVVLENKLADRQNARPEMRGVLDRELLQVAAIAPQAQKRRIDSALRNGSAGTTEAAAAAVVIARREAKESPFDSARLEKLKALEMSRGRDAMVVYLDARLSKLKQGEKR